MRFFMLCKSHSDKQTGTFFHDAAGSMIDFDALKNNVTLNSYGSLDWQH